MKQRKLCATKKAFQQQWLGRCDNYLYVRRDQPPGVETLARLWFELDRRHQPDLAERVLDDLRAVFRERA
jgi:hypothetical protein